jgi:cytochrome c oxidase subunit 1
MKLGKKVTAAKGDSSDVLTTHLAEDASHVHLPPPTFWPAGLALGITLIFWSLITSWVVFVMGAWLFVLSIVGWVRDIRHERKTHS